MSNSEDETSTDRLGIDDQQLPEDLQPGEDNPLAEGLDDGETVEDLLDGGKRADQMSDGQMSDGQISDGQISDGQISDDQISDDQMSDGGQDDPADRQAHESDDSDTESGPGAS
jgi:hypothetical protein